MAENSLLIKNGYLIDPAAKVSGKYDIVVRDGVVAEITHTTPGVAVATTPGVARRDSQLHTTPGVARRDSPGVKSVIDAANLIITPGLIDIHTHLREPGFEYKEDIKSGSRAAAAGGFTSIFCMPNTRPAIHDVDVVRLINRRATESSLVRVYPVGAITRNIAGKELSDIGEMVREGVSAISDDGNSVDSDEIMREAFKIAKGLGVLVITHPEDRSISKNGVMNEGKISKRLGFPGISEAAENGIIERDLRLCKETGARLHIAHVSTAKGIDLIREAKKNGVKVTCEVMPHHLLLTEEDVGDGNPNMKMNPPLRRDRDRKALIEGIFDFTVDAIATDHAPHLQAPPGAAEVARRASSGVKMEPKEAFLSAPFGVIGMETAFPVCMKLVESGLISLERLIELFTIGPARVTGIGAGTLGAGAPADITIFDPNVRYQIDSSKFYSKSRNTPFDKWKVKGRVVKTIVGGKVVYPFD